jgi:hypothetical protein
VKKLLLTLVIGACALLMLSSAAQAVTGTVYHPTDPSIGVVRDHHWYKACDRQVDGHRVRLHYSTWANTGLILYSAWSPSQSCTQEASTTLGVTMYQFRICVEAEGCSAWKRR